MADYYPLLAKAVAGLPSSTPEARRSIYERARKALFGQLRSLDPPVPESVIEREARALEEAVARLEVELSLDLRGIEAEEIGVREIAAPGPEAAEPTPVPQPPPSTQPVETPEDAGRSADPAQATPDLPAPPSDTRIVASQAAAPAARAQPEPLTAPTPPAEPRHAAESMEVATAAPSAAPGRSKALRRPSVPLPTPRETVPRRLWIVAAVVSTIVALVGILAYTLRDKPEDVVRGQSATQSPATDAAAGGKIVDRIGSGESQPTEMPRPATTVVKREEAPRPSLPQPEPPPAVARRAALLVEAPEEPTKVKIHLGTVVWRVENTSNGPGEPLGTAVRAEIDIPEEKLQAVMTFQKNSDSTLPASHTVKLRFVMPPGGPLGNVNRINAPYMRREDAPTGEPLNGVPVPIMENSFLVGLTKGPAEATNLDLVRTRDWLDVPMVFANGKIAKLTFEKGTSGQRAIEDALAAWQAQ